jgi:hypothetical protein
MPLQQTSGNVTADAFGGGKAVVPVYIEDVMSTFLYTGTGAAQTITNGIDLSTKGGLVWVKWRSGLVGSGTHVLVDTARGVNKFISSNTTSAEATQDTVSAFNTTGFNLTGDGGGKTNYSGDLYASWTFRKQPKFFDVVTYTGNGAARNIAHNLGSVPGCIIVKCTTDYGNWWTWHRSFSDPTTGYMSLNTTDVEDSANLFGSTIPTSTVFSLGAGASTNTSGQNFVAYIFAHNAGGFGATGADNVISCGSYTAAASAVTVNLGYEPQWVMVKSATNAANWLIIDTMRGAPNSTASSGWKNLYPNTSGAEQDFYSMITPTATGFIVDQNVNQSALVNGSGSYIYIAIRRGPMKVPTDGTKVFAPVVATNSVLMPVGFPTDLAFILKTTDGTGFRSRKNLASRLQGQEYLQTDGTESATATSGTLLFDKQNSFQQDQFGGAIVNWMFGRAPGFFDEVCYTGNYAGNPEIYHNLGVVPELIIAKNRGATTTQWYIHHAALGASQAVYFTADPVQDGDLWTRTSTYWKNASANYPTGEAHVAYLFATCPGVSKVGSYTGTGATQTIACGFAAGARFVMVKRTDASGDWYVWDSARGMVSGTDPSLLLNTTAAEVNANSVYAITTGFQIVSTAAGINASGGSYIYFSVA